MSRSIGLIGMMGAGKSTVAALLGARLGRRVVDTDDEIERWTGRSIPDIFATEGEDAFRAYEAEVVAEVARFGDLVISLGGGAVLSDDNVAHFLLTGVLIYLDVAPETLAARLEAEAEGRPLLDGDVRARVTELHADRDGRYRSVCDARIDAGAPPEEVCDRIVTWLLDNPDVLTPSEYEAVMR